MKAIRFHGFGVAGSALARGVSSILLTDLTPGRKAQIDTWTSPPPTPGSVRNSVTRQKGSY